MKPEALFFDLDGTLVNSQADSQEAISWVLRQHNRPLTTEEYAFTIGHAWGEIYEFLNQRVPVPLSLQALEEEVYQARWNKIQAQGPATLPGVPEVVQRISRKIPCVLVTGSSRKEAEMLVGAMGLESNFRFLVCAGDAPHGKPAPDPYLLAAHQLAIDPSAGIVLEDSTVGILSGRAAGMYVVAVQAGNFSGQDQATAHLIVDTLLDFETWFYKQPWARV